MNQKVLFFSTRSGLKLSEKIAYYYGNVLGKICFLKFKDGEYTPCFEQSVRGSRVFLIGSTFPPVDNLMELLLMCDAARRASAHDITLVIPYFGWARQDHKDIPRTPIAAKLVANLIVASGATRVMTMDLHADQIQGFFDIPVDHLYASRIFIDYIKKLNIDKLTMASPDMGGAKRARSYAGYLGTDVVICYKERKKANEIDFMNLIGNVKEKNIILIDDMVDTAGTLTEAANLIKEKGAKSVRAIATHPILSEKSYEKIRKSALEELVVTDTIPIIIKNSEKIRVLSCAPLFAEVMQSVHNDESISHKFII
ncbi:MAG: ribose-phosphate pyrophosphokinase [Flavobacteriales bacterium]|jgi:ribose-phosphate pyrophosphokinase|uniref:ribose-phosphate pyrophosphokinase n=1 Tax=Blattabacterium sp. (Mastotermes darwiniensis) TaxID=39768 RepID=UPI000231DDE4|nr:ribose-phosphate pyrophosphokinase [Blattabacterium sp. (Mastotermes darwiniensis)]AER40536.1 ribose-phosphate pyrophosphokinase [Blattabacterium sp. (Mastotermes darwiniensis) str. MADAR]MDR1804950.1 ribose-phosphate pyrophosphokinase [Flavobacteriales bacterium]